MFPAEKRVTAIGFISTGFLVAGIAGQVFSIVISEQMGWNTVFRMLGILYAITFLIVLFSYLKPPPLNEMFAFGQLSVSWRPFCARILYG